MSEKISRPIAREEAGSRWFNKQVFHVRRVRPREKRVRRREPYGTLSPFRNRWRGHGRFRQNSLTSTFVLLHLHDMNKIRAGDWHAGESGAQSEAVGHRIVHDCCEHLVPRKQLHQPHTIIGDGEIDASDPVPGSQRRPESSRATTRPGKTRKRNQEPTKWRSQ